MSSLERELGGSGLSVRIVHIDYYLQGGGSRRSRGRNPPREPVLRVYGATPQGTSACVHIHGVHPYFYVPCSADGPSSKPSCPPTARPAQRKIRAPLFTARTLNP